MTGPRYPTARIGLGYPLPQTEQHSGGFSILVLDLANLDELD